MWRQRVRSRVSHVPRDQSDLHRRRAVLHAILRHAGLRRRRLRRVLRDVPIALYLRDPRDLPEKSGERLRRGDVRVGGLVLPLQREPDLLHALERSDLRRARSRLQLTV
jgi:hypothetical protein